MSAKKVLKVLLKLKKFKKTKFQKTLNVLSERLMVSRSSPSDVFLGKGFLKISSKLTGDHPCHSGFFGLIKYLEKQNLV